MTFTINNFCNIFDLIFKEISKVIPTEKAKTTKIPMYLGKFAYLSNIWVLVGKTQRNLSGDKEGEENKEVQIQVEKEV